MVDVHISFQDGKFNGKDWNQNLSLARVPCVGELLLIDINDKWQYCKVKVTQVCFVATFATKGTFLVIEFA